MSKMSGSESKKILVVEDELASRVLMQEMIRAIGYEPVVAAGGAEGVELARGGGFMCIFMDIRMPGMDGYEAATAIRTFDMDVPIIAFTAYAMEWTPTKCVEAGMNDILYKPLSLERLRQEITKWAGVDNSRGLI